MDGKPIKSIMFYGSRMGSLLFFLRREKMTEFGIFINFTVLNEEYHNGKLRLVTKHKDPSPNTDPVLMIDDPADVVVSSVDPLIDPEEDRDPVLFFYLRLVNNVLMPRLVLCNVYTPMGEGYTIPYTSTGKYTVLVPTVANNVVTWAVLVQNIALKLETEELKDEDIEDLLDVAGNPHGFVWDGDDIFIGEHDSATIYQLSMADLEAATSGGFVEVTEAYNADDLLYNETGLYHHCVTTCLLTHPISNMTYLYALFTTATMDIDGYPDIYSDSSIMRWSLEANTHRLMNPEVVRVGENATTMVPVAHGRTIYLFVPALGGEQRHDGHTNRENSDLTMVDAFGNFAGNTITPDTLDPIIRGGAAQTDVTQTTYYDIIWFSISADGSVAHLLTHTYDGAYRSYWAVYQTDLSKLTGFREIKTLDEAVEDEILSQDAIGQAELAGYFHEVVYSESLQCLLHLKGNSIRISAGNDYNAVIREFNNALLLYGSSIGVVNINSLIVTGDMMALVNRGIVTDTRLGKSRTLAKTMRAAVARTAALRAAAPAEAEEEAGEK
jgi:hypothetical protein